jgi:hypothetical protein
MDIKVRPKGAKFKINGLIPWIFVGRVCNPDRNVSCFGVEAVWTELQTVHLKI